MMKVTRWWVLGVVVCSLVGVRASAQDETPSVASDGGVPETAGVEDASSVHEASTDDPDEFGEARVTTSAPAARSSLDAPRSARAEVPSPPDDETAPAVVQPPLGGDAEVFVGVTPVLSLGALGGAAGGLGSLGGLEGGITGGADFVFAVDRRIWLGLGLTVNHTESVGAGFTQSAVSVPLIAQVYLDDPRRGEATPTVRITPSFRWDQYFPASLAGYARIGGSLDVGVGVTWFVLDFLAIRILGDFGAGVMASYEGVDTVGVTARVGANVGVVIRL